MNKTSIETAKHIHSIRRVECEMVVENKFTNYIAHFNAVIPNTYQNFTIKPMFYEMNQNIS